MAASAAFCDDGSRLVSVDHYVRVKSTAPAIAGQDAHIYVREVVLAGTVLRSGPAADRVVLFVHGAGIRVGTNCACCSCERLHGSFMAAGRVERP